VESSWSTRLIWHWLGVALIVGLAWSETGWTQVPKPLSSADKPTQAEGTQAPPDALGRTTPRGTVFGFLTAAYDKRFDVAAQYLNTRGRDKDVSVLAEKLLTVLDRRLPAKLNNLSNDPWGSMSDPLDSRRELVGTIASNSGQVDIYLERVDRPNGVSIWLFSRQTLAVIPDVYEELDTVAVENLLPEFLLERYYGFTLFGWLFFLVGLPLAYFVLSILNRFLGGAFGYALRRLKKRPELNNPKILPHPARLLIVAAGLEWGLTRYSMSLVARQVGSTTVLMILILAGVWALILFNFRCEGYFRRQMERRGRMGTAGILAPARRVVDVIVALIGLMIVLYHFGVNPAAVLGGLGVGGIAVALAAQKTLENMIGGVSLIMDEALRVGDFFKVGDTIGTIEAVGLRSTRVRTLDRSVVNIPNGLMATMALENFSARDNFWLRHLVGIGYDTTPSVLTRVLDDVRRLLEADRRILPASARVRFLRFGQSSLELEIFAYVLAREWSHFLEIQEELLMRIREIIATDGAVIAYPVQTVYLKNEIEPEGNPERPQQKV